MKINSGYFISKLLKWINKPALRNCNICKTAKIGSGSNCISIEMGRYSYMGKNNSVINAKIGSFCSIASYCSIGGRSHSVDMVSTSPVFLKGKNVFRTNFSSIEDKNSKKVLIGNDVWIGEKVFIKEGINIGNGAVIGAHSVIIHDVPPYAIVAGAPSKLIRFRFSQKDIEFLENSKWWNLTKHELANKGNYFFDIEIFKKNTLTP